MDGIKGVLDRLDFGSQRAVDLRNLIADLNHRQITQLKVLQIFLVFRRLFLPLAAQRIDHAVRQKQRHIDMR